MVDECVLNWLEVSREAAAVSLNLGKLLDKSAVAVVPRKRLKDFADKLMQATSGAETDAWVVRGLKLIREGAPSVKAEEDPAHMVVILIHDVLTAARGRLPPHLKTLIHMFDEISIAATAHAAGDSTPVRNFWKEN